MFPNNYECEGQLNIWDYLTSQDQGKDQVKAPLREADDSMCEGCKWREHKNRELNVDEHGQTWVVKCPGTACANWVFGTPLNLTAEKPSKEEIVWYEPEEVIYCFNRDFLPSLEKVVQIISKLYEFEFTSYEADWNKPDNPTVYKYVFKRHSVLEISEGTYAGTDTRFIAVDWEGCKEGTACACDNLDRIFRAIDNAIYRNKHMKKPRKEENEE